MLRPRTKPSSLISHIDVTALLGVIVVLLFTVLFADPPGLLYHHHYVTPPVDFPHVKRPVSLRNANREDAVHVAIERDGSIYFRNDRISTDHLPARVAAAIRQGSEKKVYIHADARAKYGTVKNVLDAIHDAGVEQVAFLANGPRT